MDTVKNIIEEYEKRFQLYPPLEKGKPGLSPPFEKGGLGGIIIMLPYNKLKNSRLKEKCQNIFHNTKIC